MISLIVYEASWCGPCKRSHQLLEKLNNIQIKYIDIDTCGRKGIVGLPTIEIYKDNSLIDNIVGELELEDIQKIQKLND